jgi:hypothetical protein
VFHIIFVIIISLPYTRKHVQKQVIHPLSIAVALVYSLHIELANSMN